MSQNYNIYTNEQITKYHAPKYFQNRELSWLEFNKRVLDQASCDSLPLLERLKFVSIYWSNLKEFFMVRVGSLSDLELLKAHIVDKKSGWTPSEQLKHIYKKCHDLNPYYEKVYKQVKNDLRSKGVSRLLERDLTHEQKTYLSNYFRDNISPFLSPQIVNSRHPFPHLTNGALYIIVRLNEKSHVEKEKSPKANKGACAKNVTLGIIPLPPQVPRVIPLKNEEGIFEYILLENVIDMFAPEIFSMYKVKHTNIICVTRNADLDVVEGEEEQGEDYRDHMKRILKKRSRLHPVRLESSKQLSDSVKKELSERLELEENQMYVSKVPLDLSYAYDLENIIKDKDMVENLIYTPFSPQWPNTIDRNRSVINQVIENDKLLSYPYETMDVLVRLLKEAAVDPSVVSIKITLYRLASRSQLAEALIQAAENGKEVTALFELRARFDEFNNIEWSGRFEEAGCNVLYGFENYKVHSKICLITRQTNSGTQYITQLGTGNYNEKTAKLYTDLSYLTADQKVGEDATLFFQNMSLEALSDQYTTLSVAPLQIKELILSKIDEQIALKKQGQEAGIFFKTNSITDEDVINKLVEASQAGIECTLLVRGICCLVPGIQGYTENICVVSIVGRLLEHSRIYCFGPMDGDVELYLSSADLMTRNLNKRVEIAWKINDSKIKDEIIKYISICLSDNSKLRALKTDGTYTPFGYFKTQGCKNIDSQELLIKQAYERANNTIRSSNPAAIISEKTELINEGHADIEEVEEVQQDAPHNSILGNPRKEHESVSDEINSSIRKDIDDKQKAEIVSQNANNNLNAEVSSLNIEDNLNKNKVSFDSAKTHVVDVRKISEMKKVAKSIKEASKKAKSKNVEPKTEKIDLADEKAKKIGKRKEDMLNPSHTLDSFLSLFPDDNEFKMPGNKKGKRFRK